jgi:hypothetical protein
LIVQTGAETSADEPGLGLGFSIVDSSQRHAVEKERRRIEDLRLPEDPKQFLIAYLYDTKGFKAEAIERLEATSESAKVAAIARLLGDLYLDVGLIRPAEARYLNALGLSKAQGVAEGEITVDLALARIYDQVLGNKQAASQHLQAALALAKDLGDDFIVDQAGKKLAEIEKQKLP